MTAQVRDTRESVRAIGRFLAERGYTEETPRLGAELFTVRRGRGLGPFLPYTDYVFVHDLDSAADPASFERRHAEAFAYADTQFPLPRIMRYRIPNAVSIGVSATGLAPETVAFARKSKLRSHLAGGGAKDSAYLIDLASATLISAGLESTPTKYGSIESSVNPTNRVFETMVELAAASGWDIDVERSG